MSSDYVPSYRHRLCHCMSYLYRPTHCVLVVLSRNFTSKSSVTFKFWKLYRCSYFAVWPSTEYGVCMGGGGRGLEGARAICRQVDANLIWPSRWQAIFLIFLRRRPKRPVVPTKATNRKCRWSVSLEVSPWSQLRDLEGVSVSFSDELSMHDKCHGACRYCRFKNEKRTGIRKDWESVL